MGVECTDVSTAETEGGWGSFVYRRPKTLNCASVEMVASSRAAMSSWRDKSSIKAMMMSGEGGRAFCSGGDVKDLRASLLTDAASPRPEEQVFEEYNFIYENKTGKKPIVVLMDGVVMGFGLGLASSARFRVGTETTRLAMPENNIGLFPDVGFAYMAANAMAAGVGRLMATTACHLIGARDALASGLATHFVPKERLPELEAALQRLDLSGDADVAITECLASFAQEPPAEPSTLASNMDLVDAFAKADSLKDACAALESAAAAGGWAQEVLKAMGRGAPFSQAVAWRLMQLAEADAKADMPEPRRMAIALERDFATARRLLYRSDFSEGVRVVLVDKGADPIWQWKSIGEVSEEEVVAATTISTGERQLGMMA